MGQATRGNAEVQRHRAAIRAGPSTPTTRVGNQAVQRAMSPAQQAADSSDSVAWLKLITALISGLGVKGILPPSLEFTIGMDTLGEPIRAHLVPGHIDDIALVVAGVHGSEQSGVEVADRLLQQLQTHQPYFTVVIVPRLFPDNVASRAAWERKLAADQGKIAAKKYRELRTKAGDPGRSTPGKKDPNRQFPALGAELDMAKPLDAKGDPVEPGNMALLALIKQFAPRRLVSIHAQKDLEKAGVFADPHPTVAAGSVAAGSVASGSLAKEADEVAIATAKRAQVLGARVAGNTRGGGFSSLYPGQNPALSKKKMAEENAKGHSLGQWGPSKGVMVLTVEVSEQYTSTGAVTDPNRADELEAGATAIREVVLGPPPVAAGGTSAGTAGGAADGAVGGTAAGAPGAPTPVQRLVLNQVACSGGNRAATAAVQRLREPVNDERRKDVSLQRVRQNSGLSSFSAAVFGAVSAVAGGTATVTTALTGGLRDLALGLPAERAMLKRLVMSGVTNPEVLTRAVFAMRHPETIGRALSPKVAADKALLRERKTITKHIVLPAIKRYRPADELSQAELAKRIRRATEQATSGGAESARVQIAADIRTFTGGEPEAWFAQHVPNARFLGVPITASDKSTVGGVHQDLLTKLDLAAATLEAHPTLQGRTGIEIADALGVNSIGGLRQPKAATGAERPSLHCYGLAVDINYPTNPFIGLYGSAVPKMIERATLLMRGESFRIDRPPAIEKDAMAQWVATHLASADVVAYLNLDHAGLETQLHTMLAMSPSITGSARTLDWWLDRQREDRALKGKGDFKGGRDPSKTGIMDLDERLVEALDQAGLTWGGMYQHSKDLMHFDDRSRFRKSGS